MTDARSNAKFPELVRDGVRHVEMGMKLDRMGSSPDAAERYRKAAENLNIAAGSCSLEGASKAASEFAKKTEEFAATVFPDASGKAVVLYKKAITMLSDAVAMCSEGNCNKADIENHIANIEVRVMYLESLDGSPPTIPIEDHIGKLYLRTDEEEVDPSAVLSEPIPAQGETIGTGETAVRIAPTLGMEAPPSSVNVDSMTVPSPLESHVDSVIGSSIVELGSSQANTKDQALPESNQRRLSDTEFLNRAVEMEREGHELESKNCHEQALNTFTNCLEIYAILQKREKNPRIKEVIRSRMAELLDHAEVLKAKMTLGAL